MGPECEAYWMQLSWGPPWRYSFCVVQPKIVKLRGRVRVTLPGSELPRVACTAVSAHQGRPDLAGAHALLDNLRGVAKLLDTPAAGGYAHQEAPALVDRLSTADMFELHLWEGSAVGSA